MHLVREYVYLYFFHIHKHPQIRHFFSVNLFYRLNVAFSFFLYHIRISVGKEHIFYINNCVRFGKIDLSSNALSVVTVPAYHAYILCVYNYMYFFGKIFSFVLKIMTWRCEDFVSTPCRYICFYLLLTGFFSRSQIVVLVIIIKHKITSHNICTYV